VKVLLVPIAMLASLTVSIGLAAEPVFVLATRAAEQLIDREGYIRAVLGGPP
jgi:multicomponent Na+:H+ antiporter subunit D